jgi:menaquinone-dependent protoporphyrinogen IX oxidase
MQRVRLSSAETRGNESMKGLVVYDSYYGNTKLVAEAIAEQLKAEGHEAELRSVREKYLGPPQGGVMFLGSPVRMGSTTRRVKKFIKKLDKDIWKDESVVVFTTILLSPRTQPTSRKRAGRSTTSPRAANSATWRGRKV